MFYDVFLKMLRPAGTPLDEKPSTAIALTAGALTGMMMWGCLYPVDICKTRIQLDSFTQPKYTGGLKQVYNEIAADGFKNFYRGFSPVAVRAVPVNAITFAAYEMAFDFIRKDKKKH